MYYITQRHSVLFIYVVVVVILESPLCFCNRLWVGDYAPYIYTMYPSRRRSRPKCSLSCWEGFIKYSNG